MNPDVKVTLDIAQLVILGGLVWSRRDLGRLRWSLLIGFGGGWIAWVGYCFMPGLEMWGLYQATRVVAAAMFCWANVSPRLRLV